MKQRQSELGARRRRNWMSKEQRYESESLCLSFILSEWEVGRRKIAGKDGCSMGTPPISNWLRSSDCVTALFIKGDNPKPLRN